jgi:hypothetical protein
MISWTVLAMSHFARKPRTRRESAGKAGGLDALPARLLRSVPPVRSYTGPTVTRSVSRAMTDSSSVRMTRTVHALPSAEMTALDASLRASSR